MMNLSPLTKSVAVLLLLFLVTGGLYFARDLLIPLTFGALISMLFVPLSIRLEKRGINRAVANLICIVVLLSFFGFIAVLLSWQASNLLEDVSQVQQKVIAIVSEIRQYISESFGLSAEEQKKWLQKQSSSMAAGPAKMGGAVFTSSLSVVVDLILALVYIFLFLYFRRHLKKFLLMLVPQSKEQETNKIVQDAAKVSQQYLVGLAAMIVTLWVLYGIGFSIVGVKSAIFLAILCGLLEIAPFVGNLTGTALTVLMVISQGGGTNMVVGVLITYITIQLIQTYLLEPLVVGREVNINPLFTILVLVVMEMIWSVPGMILAIPMLGIFKIICDHVPSLKPYGFLIGRERRAKEDSGLIKKIKRLFETK